MGSVPSLTPGLRMLAAAAAGLTVAATLVGACTLDRNGTLTGVGGQGGTATSCDKCPGSDSDCSYRTCEDGECGIANALAGSPCNEDGGQVCDGVGSCVACTEASHCGTQQVCDRNVCVPGECIDDTQNGSETDVDCGGGVCAPCLNGNGCQEALDCVSVFCDGGTCAACSGAGDCGAIGGYCEGGICHEKKELGETCFDGSWCLSGHCPAQDGVCCDAACDATCEACQGSKTGGEDGTCALVPANDDPDGECPDDGVENCDSNGDGCTGDEAACILYPAGTVCTPAGCAGGVENDESLCDGNGNCPIASTTPCNGYACNGDTCYQSCTAGGSECDSTHDCAADDTCKLANGQDCNVDGDCASDICNWEGVCCNEDCAEGDTCVSCLGQYNGGNQGTCDFIPVGDDPYNECNSPPTDQCAGDGTCQ